MPGYCQDRLQLNKSRFVHYPDFRNDSSIFVHLIISMLDAYTVLIDQADLDKFRRRNMRNINQVYINGAFVTPHGSEIFDVINPTTEQVIARVTLADVMDTRRAVAAAKKAFPAFARTTKDERVAMLKR